MLPWDPSTERGVGDKLWNNAKDFVGMNFDRDPSRFSTKQIADAREAFMKANEEVKLWNPSQVEGWSDGEILDRIIDIGNGKYPKIANKFREYYHKFEEE